MYINEQYRALPLLEQNKYTYISRNGDILEETENTLHEHVIDVYVNDILSMKLICIPEYLTELVLGRLLTEGMIKDTNDVESIFICEYGKRARVILKNQFSNKSYAKDNSYIEETSSCCTGNHILNDYFLNYKDVNPVTPITWKPDWIFSLADKFAEGSPLHDQTFATHSCFLSKNGNLLFQCEDIGRHNALDKVIGYALRHNIDLCKCIVYSSGRIPTDMVMKTIRARIPVLASKASPTDKAVELAKEYQLTLICAARRDRMKQF